MEPPLPKDLGLWPPIHQAGNLSRGERGQYQLRLFQLPDAEVLARGAALCLCARSAPVQIRIDGANGGVAARGLKALFTHPQHSAFQFVFSGRIRLKPLEAVLVPLQRGGRNVREVLPFTDELLKMR